MLKVGRKGLGMRVRPQKKGGLGGGDHDEARGFFMILNFNIFVAYQCSLPVIIESL